MTSDQENKAIVEACQKPEGMIERELMEAIKNAVRVFGFAGARGLIAEKLNDIAGGR